jgi:ATP-dependent DNA helicase DinG
MKLDSMQRYFGPEGILARNAPGFEHRSSQLGMAQEVLASLQDGVPLLLEAGTGTGKTWAYLIPALLSGQRVVVSTRTKTLQDQILDHDIPFLKQHVFPQLKAVCLKGRKNYLCRRKFQLFAVQPNLWKQEEAKLLWRFQQWASTTKTGDRAEIDWLPDDIQMWHEVSSSTEQCLGQLCPEQPRCFLNLLRQEASRAHLLIVNHHLFFAHLAMRSRGQGEILPEFDAVILDEAHQMEDVISQFFGLQFGNQQIDELVNDLHREFSAISTPVSNRQEVLNISKHLGILSRRLCQDLASSGFPGRFPLPPCNNGDAFTCTCREMSHALKQLSACLGASRELTPVLESLLRRCADLNLSIEQILDERDPSLVYWYELSSRSVNIRGTPIDISNLSNQWVSGKSKRVVMTSATLTVSGSFDTIKMSLGMPPDTREVSFPSPFNYQRQALIYVPKDLPLPRDDRFCDSVAEEALNILGKTRGRGLFLFTSYKNMYAVYELLNAHLPYPLLVQGNKPKRQLLSEFKRQIDSVLLATSSFWQGIDVPGEALSCLLIDKLPFEVPDDPLVAARMEHMARLGSNPFYGYQAPRAVIHLKQGIGRLIRSSQDRGVIVIFDVRLITKSYGRMFLESMPACAVTREISCLEDFLNKT